jgi:hypothetical protein
MARQNCQTDIRNPHVHRTYLYVPPEGKVEVQTLGAQWDGDSKRWYIGSGQNAAKFAKWLPRAAQADAPDDEPHEDEPFTIVSSQASVASTTTPCQRCNSNIEVVCIHCESGTASGEPPTRFTVSHIWAIEEDLARQLRRWHFHKVIEPDDGTFANHCPTAAHSRMICICIRSRTKHFSIFRARRWALRGSRAILVSTQAGARFLGFEHVKLESVRGYWRVPVPENLATCNR